MATTPDSSDLARMAVQAALNCQWQEALDLNGEIQKLEPNNIECLNRTAKAYFELGEFNLAKKAYQQVIEIDPYNNIALKNLKKLTSIKNTKSILANGYHTIISPSLFLEEPGVTTVVTLVKVAEPQKLLILSPGMEVKLNVKKRGITVMDQANQYLGAFPDDSAHHLSKLIKGGNKYQVIIKSVRSNGLIILIREIFRSKKFRNQASFLDDAKILAYSSDNISFLKDTQDDSSDMDSEEEAVI